MVRRAVVFCLAIFTCCASFSQKVLVFSKTAGYHHASIPAGIEAIKKIGAQNNFSVDTTTDASKFTDENLKQYKVIIFLSTTGDLFDTLQKQAFQRYVRNNGGVVGIHAATDAEYKWPWYGKLMGAYFESHPKQQTANVVVKVRDHAATKGLPEVWTRFDEWYNFKELNKDLYVLLTLDESSYTGGKNGNYHPVSWMNYSEGGTVFYTALGHTDSSYIEPLFLQHLTGGIMYVLNRYKPNESDPLARAPSHFDAKLGFEKFLLGAKFTSFDTTKFKSMGEPLVWKGKTEYAYSYQPSFNEPILIGGVPFNNVALTFDETGTLMRIWLSKLYLPRWYAGYKELANNKYSQLTKFMRGQLNSKGKSKTFSNYKTSRAIGYEWMNTASKTIISFSEDTGTKQPSNSVDLTFK